MNELVNFTDRAAEEALKMSQSVESYQGLPIRIYIEGKGCDGFTYGVAFDKVLDDDHSFKSKGLHVIVDKDSRQFLENSIIDWVDDERGKGFLVENPNQKSYRGKFFKRKSWQKR